MIEFYIGIDNGISSWIAVMDKEGDLIHGFETPWNEIIVQKGTKSRKEKKRKVYDLNGIMDLMMYIRQEYGKVFIAIEKSQPFQSAGKDKTGASRGALSNFSTGYGYGVWTMCLMCFEFRHIVVPARTWQSIFLKGVKGADTKSKSIEAAIRRWPKVNFKRTERCRNLDHNLTDAAWIAEYGRRSELGLLS